MEKQLKNGVPMPEIGLGVYKMTDEEEAYRAIRHALEVGYRSIDTAAFYHNEEVVGRAVRESGIPREEIFITTKVWNDDTGYEETLHAFEQSLEKLGLDYIDSYLTHWPVPGKYVETYRAILKLTEEGKVRASGVCNHTIEQLETIHEELGEYPNINQVEIHPYLQQRELMAFCREHHIAVTAWAPLGRGQALQDPAIREVAKRYGITPAQTILQWHLQQGRIIIPKSVTPSRIDENFAVGQVELTDECMESINELECNGRTGANPADPNFLEHFK
ncbi:aldo/keto reductase [Savagea sp. SN6]|uniref:Aldo/keto reductase n=1 Tax=Savagea serpentis TaxID=2785297 RepID=A0A8J7G2Z4_9BACL|nr:aldo/keto reductase [Savagea serpentis]MBF4500507.1 aldo/keto reductase [Savagea serpentis]